MAHFEVGPTGFLLDGEPYRILSGAIHYFRVHPDLWRDRIHKAALMGLNTIETYVAWNFHAPTPDTFRTDGDRDLGRFLDVVAEEGLHAVVRPGPYICAEWTNGGLPTWLTARPDIRVRSSDRGYLDAVEPYLRRVGEILGPRQVDRGGPVILVQVENEYGAYGDDRRYLEWLRDTYRGLGVVVPLSTVDQPIGEMLQRGSLPDLLSTGSFGSRVPERLARLRAQQPVGPLMCAEFWDGWFDSWGLPHHVTSAAEAAASLDALLRAGASVNLYMFHGGTNFGLSNGANDKGLYQPVTTSYDYDAPLAEDGSLTAKFWAFREVIARYAPVPEAPTDERVEAPTIEFSLDRGRDWLPEYGERVAWTQTSDPSPLDDCGHPGFLAYRTAVAADGPATLVAPDVRDRAQVFFDGDPVGVLSRDSRETVLRLPCGAHGRLDVLVEDLGRVDYGHRLGEQKGLGDVRLHGTAEPVWWSAPVPLDPDEIAEALRLRGRPLDPDAPVGGPVLLSGTFSAPAGTDLFLDTSTFGKGVVWLNGFALGRYWSRGPQRTLYVPGPVVREGTNELLLLELHGLARPVGRFVGAPQLGPSAS